MLVLSTLHNLLAQILSLPDLHTALLLTPEGQLVSFAAETSRPKDEILVVVGLSGEVWRETRGQGFGMVDSEVISHVLNSEDRGANPASSDQLGRILVLPVEETEVAQGPNGSDRQPLMLLALNSTDSVEWDDLQTKVKYPRSFAAGNISYIRFRERCWLLIWQNP